MALITAMLVFLAFIALFVLAFNLSIKVDRLKINLECANKQLIKEVEYRKRLYNEFEKELKTYENLIGTFKKSPYIVEKKAEVKTFNFQKIYPFADFSQEYIYNELKEAVCKELKLNLPNSYIKYKAEYKPYSDELQTTATILLIEPLE